MGFLKIKLISKRASGYSRQHCKSLWLYHNARKNLINCRLRKIKQSIMRRSIKGTGLYQLKKAFQLTLRANRHHISDATALAEEEKYLISRRKFIIDMSKAAAVIGIAGIYEACSPVNKKTQPTILIVGGGIAGLHAAYVLKSAGYTAEVYEASPRTGGRIMSVAGMMGEGLWTEMGGEFIDSDHEDMLNLVRHFNLPLIDRRSTSELQLHEFTYYFDKKYYQLADVLKAIQPVAEQIRRDIDSLSEEITYENHSPADVLLDNISIEEYLAKLGISGWFKEFITSAYTAESGLALSERS